jgi:ribonuclease D
MGQCDYVWIERQEELHRIRVDGWPEEMAVDLEADSLYRFTERICLVQISTSSENLVIDALSITSWEPLRQAIESAQIRKVFHGADYDIRLLKRHMQIKNPRNLFDTMIAAQLLGISKVSLSDLLRDFMGVNIEKRYQKADWGRRPLPKEMISYAVKDTCYLLELSHLLEEKLREAGRWAWAREEFESLCIVEPLARSQPDVWDIKGAGGLRDRERAVLRELISWRQQEAQRRDIPPFKVLRNEVLVELARQSPSSRHELLKIKGMNKRMVEWAGDSILEAIERGRKAQPPRPEVHNPSPPRRPGTSRRFSALKEIRDKKASELGINPGFLCPNHTLRVIAGLWPEQLDKELPRLLVGWRLELLRGPFMDVLRG